MAEKFAVCAECQESKPLTTSARCRKCWRESLPPKKSPAQVAREFRARNPGYYDKYTYTPKPPTLEQKEAAVDRAREYRYKKLYGMTVAEYDLLFEFQDGVCAICRKPPKKNRLAVDHDHKTGLVRGLLCATCNRTLHERVTVDWLHDAYEYLDTPPVNDALGRTPQGVVGRVKKRRRRRKAIAKGAGMS